MSELMNFVIRDQGAYIEALNLQCATQEIKTLKINVYYAGSPGYASARKQCAQWQ